MSRYRTVRGVIQYIREKDPDSAITEYFLRQLLVNDKIRYKKAGTKYLIDLDDVESFFNMGERDED